jgi:hypothetical protein
LEDLNRIWNKNPRFHDELAMIRPQLERHHQSDPEGFALELRPDGSAVGLEPELPLERGANVAIGVEYIVKERRVYRAWIYIRPKRA